MVYYLTPSHAPCLSSHWFPFDRALFSLSCDLGRKEYGGEFSCRGRATKKGHRPSWPSVRLPAVSLWHRRAYRLFSFLLLRGPAPSLLTNWTLACVCVCVRPRTPPQLPSFPLILLSPLLQPFPHHIHTPTLYEKSRLLETIGCRAWHRKRMSSVQHADLLFQRLM